jgi:hypothetical protein
MRMTRVCWIGVAMMTASLTLLVSAILWSNTRTWRLVDHVPISLAQGAHYSTGELPVNLNARYEISIYMDNNIPSEKLQCTTLGTPEISQHCKTPYALSVRWTVLGAGKTVHGNSDKAVEFHGSSPGMEETDSDIGEFRGQKGQHYRLDIDVLSDTGSLNVTNPRLSVHEEDPSLEFNLVLIPFLGIFCTVIAAIVGLMLIGSFLAQRRDRRVADLPR